MDNTLVIACLFEETSVPGEGTGKARAREREHVQHREAAP